MKLFWKIFATVFIAFVATVSFISYVISDKQISDAENHIVEENQIAGSFISKEIEVDYLQSRWPFESLKKLSERENFLFWWIVRDDGTIHLSDQTSFMENQAYEYYPQMVNRVGNENVFQHHKQNYGIFVNPLKIEKGKWSFWLGFSMREASEMRKQIILLHIVVSMSALMILGIILYFAIKHFTKPIEELIISAAIVGKGDLNHRTEIESKDELGRLAHSFNKMTEDLQKTTVSRDYVDNIIESMSDSLIVIDPNKEIRRVNSATCQLLGYKEEKLIGKPIEPIWAMAAEMPLKEATKLEELIEAGELRNYETYYNTKDGQQVPILLSSSVVKDKDGDVTSIVCVGRDITQLKAAHALLDEKNTELESFVYTVSHDLKAPLVSLEGYASMLIDNYEESLDETGRLYLARIRANVEDMGNLIQDLLELSRIGKVVYDCDPVDVTEIIREVIETLEMPLSERRTELVIQDNLPMIICDRVRIKQVFENLVSNANKFMGKENDKPKIEMGFHDQGDSFEFFVKDNGIGIQKEYHDEVFDIFTRIGDLEAEGTGVGLAIVKKIVDTHGGNIRIDSDVGKGTTVYFTLPKTSQNNPENSKEIS